MRRKAAALKPAAPAAPAVPEKKRSLAPYARFAVLATLGAAVILLAVLAGERLPYFMMAAECEPRSLSACAIPPLSVAFSPP